MRKILLLILVLALVGCSSNTGTLVMQITDAPADLNIEKAVVTISGIDAHMAGADNESGWVTVLSGSQTFDLVELKDVTDLLGETQLTVGKYTQIRLSVDSAKVTIDDVEYDLEVPSEKLKLVKNFDIVADAKTVLTLDFDAQESVIASGNSYKLKPTIKVLSEAETKATGKSPK